MTPDYGLRRIFFEKGGRGMMGKEKEVETNQGNHMSGYISRDYERENSGTS